MAANSVLTGAIDCATDLPVRISLQYDGVNSVVRINGVDDISGDAGSNGMTSGLTVGATAGLINPLLGTNVFEFIPLSAVLSAADRSTLEADQAAYFGS